MASSDYRWYSTAYELTTNASSGSTALDSILVPSNYNGEGDYLADDEESIKVDKGSPDKARHVIFYAILDQGDPMIFCKNKKELKSELDKLMKRDDVDKKSIRVFNLSGAMIVKK